MSYSFFVWRFFYVVKPLQKKTHDCEQRFEYWYLISESKWQKWKSIIVFGKKKRKSCIHYVQRYFFEPCQTFPTWGTLLGKLAAKSS